MIKKATIPVTGNSFTLYWLTGIAKMLLLMPTSTGASFM